MRKEYEQALGACVSAIGETSSTTSIKIKETITAVNSMFKMLNQELTDSELSCLYDDLMSMYTTNIDQAQILEGKERREPWLDEFKARQSCKWNFWLRYREHLLKHEHYPQKAVAELDRITDVILDKMFNPKKDNIVIEKKGLVVGLVQSGKTSNYTGLICKAADAGFNLIIVLAGLHNNLRSQTQQRLDEGFLGFDTQYARVANNAAESNKIGVGLIKNNDYKNAIANSLTTSMENGDFSKDALKTTGLNFDNPQPFLLVVKKNASVLKNLLQWLDTQSKDKICNKNVLIIDDEADNASVNTSKPEEDPTAINNAIRKIMAKCTKTAYVGYTATPFANIFIPLDTPGSEKFNDLFPSDFIINLPTPDTYIGPAKIFGVNPEGDKKEDTLPVAIPIDDYIEYIPEKQKKNDPIPSELPPSLKVAIKSFIVTCAIRRVRGQENKHNSMLIHVSRFQNWHEGFRDKVNDVFEFYKSNIEDKDPQILEEIRKIFEEDSDIQKSYKTITKAVLDSDLDQIKTGITEIEWNNVKEQLIPAVQKIKVKAINGSSGDVLDYKDHEKTGISVIAIGGDKLSRGLTLEGLSISYFLRPSKMYDTLMQMGRWFGYRPGYVDLCRLYTSQQLIDWYKYIAIATEELRSEFNFLADSNGTPDQFAVKVRTHPGQLQVTALGKRRNSTTIQVSWASKVVESRILCKDKASRDHNLQLTNELLSSIGSYESLTKKTIEEEATTPNCFLWKDIDHTIICDYLSKFKLPESYRTLVIDRVIDFIRQVVRETGGMNSWNVGIVSKIQKNVPKYTFSNGLTVGSCKRQREDDDKKNYHLHKNRVIGNPSDEYVDLSDELIMRAKSETKRIKESKGKEWNEKDFASPLLVREKYRPKETPLLLFYPIEAQCANRNDDLIYDPQDNHPIMGFTLAFPATDGDVVTKYMVNNVLAMMPNDAAENYEED